MKVVSAATVKLSSPAAGYGKFTLEVCRMVITPYPVAPIPKLIVEGLSPIVHLSSSYCAAPVVIGSWFKNLWTKLICAVPSVSEAKLFLAWTLNFNALLTDKEVISSDVTSSKQTSNPLFSGQSASKGSSLSSNNSKSISTLGKTCIEVVAITSKPPDNGIACTLKVNSKSAFIFKDDCKGISISGRMNVTGIVIFSPGNKIFVIVTGEIIVQ